MLRCDIVKEKRKKETIKKQARRGMKVRVKLDFHKERLTWFSRGSRPRLLPGEHAA